MTGPDASWHEMPGFTLPGWPGRDADDQLLDTILAGLPLPPSAPREYHTVAAQLAGLATPPGPGPLPGETAALAAFSSSVSSGSLSSVGTGDTGPGAHRSGAAPDGTTARRAARRRGARRSGLLTTGRARIATAVTALSLVLGTTAAAYAGALPAQVQDFAHRLIGAPAAHHPAGHPHPTVTQRPGSQHVRPAAHPSHQPPGQQPDRTPPGQAKGHQKHRKPPRPGRTPKLHDPGNGGHQPG
jgi:hypothetical protein